MIKVFVFGYFSQRGKMLCDFLGSEKNENYVETINVEDADVIVDLSSRPTLKVAELAVRYNIPVVITSASKSIFSDENIKIPILLIDDDFLSPEEILKGASYILSMYDCRIYTMDDLLSSLGV